MQFQAFSKLVRKLKNIETQVNQIKITEDYEEENTILIAIPMFVLFLLYT